MLGLNEIAICVFNAQIFIVLRHNILEVKRYVRVHKENHEDNWLARRFVVRQKNARSLLPQREALERPIFFLCQ